MQLSDHGWPIEPAPLAVWQADIEQVVLDGAFQNSCTAPAPSAPEDVVSRLDIVGAAWSPLSERARSDRPLPSVRRKMHLGCCLVWVDLQHYMDLVGARCMLLSSKLLALPGPGLQMRGGGRAQRRPTYNRS